MAGGPAEHPGALVSVVIPTFDEERTIEEVIRRVVAVPFRTEILVVDDGSTDRTAAILARVQREIPQLRALPQPVNRGKGAAVRVGISASQGDIVVIQDADLEYDPQDYGAMLDPILEGHADVVFGNRFHGGAHRVLYFWHAVGNRFLTTLCNMVTNLNLTDMEVGYKVFRTEILKQIQLHSSRFGFEPEITVKVAKLGCRIYEVPISYYGRTYAEGKKIGWRDGIAAFFHIIRYRFFD
jgi:glycosyltransferase involved in cell wall biosynthesis